MRQAKRLREIQGSDSTMADEKWAKRNGRVVSGLKEVHTELEADYADTVYAELVAEFLQNIGALD